MRRRGGFTLIEVLVTIGIIGLLLGEMAALFRAGTAYTYNSNIQSENMWIARTALDMMVGEFRQALTLYKPASAEDVPELLFVRPTPDGSSTDFHVLYYLSEHRLMRKTWNGNVEPPDDAGNVRTMLEGVLRLRCSAMPGEVSCVQISVVADQGAAGDDAGSLAGAISGMATARATE